MTVPRSSAAIVTFLCAGALACASSPPETAPEPAPPAAPSAPPPAAPAAPVAPPPAFSFERQARELAAIPGAQVARKDDVLTVRFAGTSLFESTSAELTDAGQERVRSLARAVADEPRERIVVRGHTDSQRDERASQTLSEELADSVRNLLVAEGVVPSRITAVGLAASQPVATNSTEEGRRQNRRIEIELWPEPELTQGGGPQ
jgi:outer membrane protein OmpA-like peptidoglycan-associated protein